MTPIVCGQTQVVSARSLTEHLSIRARGVPPYYYTVIYVSANWNWRATVRGVAVYVAAPRQARTRPRFHFLSVIFRRAAWPRLAAASARGYSTRSALLQPSYGTTTSYMIHAPRAASQHPASNWPVHHVPALAERRLSDDANPIASSDYVETSTCGSVLTHLWDGRAR